MTKRQTATTAADFFKTPTDVFTLVYDAMPKALPGDETAFLEKLYGRLQAHGLKTFLSRKQVQYVKRIAARAS